MAREHGHQLGWYQTMDHEALAQLAFEQRVQVKGLHLKINELVSTLRNTRRNVARLRYNAGLPLDEEQRRLLNLPRAVAS